MKPNSHFSWLLLVLLFTETRAQNDGKEIGDSNFSVDKPSATSHHELKELKPVQIGDKVPDISLGRLLNHPYLKSAKISDFRGKYLILDFWSTWCSVCIAQFPKLQALQEKFKNDVTILPVGFDGNIGGSIEKFISTKKGTKGELKLPTAVQGKTDTLLSTLFPYLGFPHTIWIDPSGNLLGITDQRAFTEENFTLIQNGKNPNFAIKKKPRLLSAKDNFLLNRTGISQVYGSALSGYIDTLTNYITFGEQLDSSVYRFFVANRTVTYIYSKVYGSKLNYLTDNSGQKRIIREGPSDSFLMDWKEAKQLDYNSYSNFKRNNLFCYELILPRKYSISEAYDYMIRDLDRLFSINSKIEKRNLKCYVLRPSKGADLQQLSSLSDKLTATSKDDSISYKGIDLMTLTEELNGRIESPLLILNETRVNNKIDISLPSTTKEIESFRTALRKKQLELVETERMIDCLILKTENNALSKVKQFPSL